MGRSKSRELVKIPCIESVKLYLLSVVLGIWYVCLVLVKLLWKNKHEDTENRGNPPACFIDSSIGNHLFIKIRGVKLHYVEAGDKSLPVLLLLHGFPDCWISWREQIPELSKHFRVVALDLKGFGDSDKPVSLNSYHPASLVAELSELVDSLTQGRVTLVGHGLGGLVAWFYLHMKTESVAKIVCISAPHPNFFWTMPKSSLFNYSWTSLCQLPMIPEMKAMENDMKVINSAHEHLSPTKPYGKQFLDGYKYIFSRKEDWTGAINYYRTLPFWRLPPRKLDVPCLLVMGNEDKNIKLESIIKSTEYLEKFNMKIIDGASHYVHQQKPQEVNKILLDFLADNVSFPLSKSQSDGLVYRMFGAMTSTVKYGNTVFDAVQKKTGDLATRALSMRQNTG